MLGILETCVDELAYSRRDCTSSQLKITIFVCLRRLVRAWAKEGTFSEKVSGEQLFHLLNISAVRIDDTEVGIEVVRPRR